MSGYFIPSGGAGSTFRKYYPEYYDLALSYGLDPALKPTKLDISATRRLLGYKPSYSLARLLSDLAAYGDSGPPAPGVSAYQTRAAAEGAVRA